MKTLLALMGLVLLVGQNAQSQVVIDPVPNADSPIAIKLVKIQNPDVDTKMYEDSGAVVRASSYTGTYAGTTTTTVRIYNSAGLEIGSTDFTGDQRKQMSLVLSRISQDCPVTLQIDRATRKIVRVTPTCDELGER